MATDLWYLLTYKVPAEPNRRRVALWRRLKGLGAVYLQGGTCLLPKTDDHLRALKVIENEIAEMGGDAVLLESSPLDVTQSEKVVARFRAERNEQYEELVDKCTDFEAEIAKEIASDHFTYAEVEENDEDLKKLKTWYAKIKALDFYEAPLAPEALSRIADCEALLDNYAHQVFARQDENRSPRDEV
ncbi:Chromate resistance protein ChrB [Devosia sp.]|uniref:Chromate resistance protein ChrB n=1 Tax=Devosia sp. TaxID=1871048 RepID=UPI001A088656|nr:Chromate resistance protein ChrB [Devosia sp.]MBE0581918.1 chromate resistance protein ChrB [Devosia sp.]